VKAVVPLIAIAASLGAASAARSEIVVSANDGKATLIDGVNAVPANPPADYVAVIELGDGTAKVVGEIEVPASVVGPPMSVAISPDASFALVTGAMKIDPNDKTKVIADDKLSVIDLKTSPPKLLAQLQAGKGAAGVSINRSGTLALVANRMEGTVSAFTIADRTLTAAGKIELGSDKSGPSHVAITPDGKTALVTRDGDNKISVLAIEGSKVDYTKHDMSAGLRPYGIEIDAAGRFAVVANIGPGSGDADTASLIDLELKPPRVVHTASVGQTPEGIALSHDGAFVAFNLGNGSNKPKASPFYNDYGLLKIMRIKGKELAPLTEAKIGHWCQGVAWSKDDRMLLVQCMVEKEIMLFGFDGKELKPAGSISLKAGPAGIRAQP
jgi:DNA-binding beta-propeller fold protein YncE